MTPQRQRVATSAFIFNDGRVLLLKRASHEKFLPGYYDLPGGKVDPGESPDLAVLRETKEEAGIDGTILGIYNTWHWTSIYRQEATQFISISYALTVPSDKPVLLHEDFEDYLWVAESELPALLITEDLRRDIKKGFEWFNSRARFDESALLRQAIQDGISRLAVGAIVRNEDGKGLLLRRAPGEFLKGLWELPSGKVEALESLECALSRELLEETALELDRIESCEGYFDYRSKSGKLTRQFNFLASVKHSQCRVNPAEHDKFEWVDVERTGALEISAEVRAILGRTL